MSFALVCLNISCISAWARVSVVPSIVRRQSTNSCELAVVQLTSSACILAFSAWSLKREAHAMFEVPLIAIDLGFDILRKVHNCVIQARVV